MNPDAAENDMARCMALCPHASATACREEDETDPKSRHVGKLNTESMLEKRGVNYTSIRPVYIYGPLNYNPVEEFFFHRLAEGRPLCVPGSGMQVRFLNRVNVTCVHLCLSWRQTPCA